MMIIVIIFVMEMKIMKIRKSDFYGILPQAVSYYMLLFSDALDADILDGLTSLFFNSVGNGRHGYDDDVIDNDGV